MSVRSSQALVAAIAILIPYVTMPVEAAAPATGPAVSLGQPVAITPAEPKAVGSAVPAASSTGPLGVQDVVRLVIARDPSVRAARAAVDDAQASYRSLAAFPPLDLAVTRSMGNTTAPTLNGATTDTFIDLGTVVDTSGQRRMQAGAALALTGTATYQRDEALMALTQEARDAYWSLVAAQAQTKMASQTLSDVEKVGQLTQIRFQAGDVPRLDVIHSGVDAANAVQAQIAARSAEAMALDNLNVLLGRQPGAPLELADQFDPTANPASTEVGGSAPINLMPGLPDLDTLTRQALQNRPLIKAAREQVRAQDYTLKQALATRYPDVSVDLQRSIETPVQALLVSVHLPILDFGSIQQSIRAARAAKRQAEAQEQQAEQQVARQVGQAYQDYERARRIVATYSADILQPSVTLLSMAQTGYREGLTGMLPVIDAENTLRSARSGYVDAILGLYTARDEVATATATELQP